MGSKKCSNISGSNLYVKVAEEEIFGDYKSGGFMPFKTKSNSVKFTQNKVDSELLTAGRSPARASNGNIEVTGDLEFAVEPNTFGFFVKQLMGDHKVEQLGTQYKHTFSISDTCLPSFQIEKGFLGSYACYRATGLKANELNIEFGGEGDLIGKISVIGKNEYMDLQPEGYQYVVPTTVPVNTSTKTFDIDTIPAGGTINAKAGDVIAIQDKKGTLAVDLKKGGSVFEVGAGEGAAFKKGDFITFAITGTEVGTFQVLSVSGDRVYLARPADFDTVAGTEVFLFRTAFYRVSEITGSTLVLDTALKGALTADSKLVVYPEIANATGDHFGNFQIIYEEAGKDGEDVIALMETLSFTYSNGLEGKRFAKNKGAYGRILEGKTSITCELDVLFDSQNAAVIERAKTGVDFGIKIIGSNSKGEELTINLPRGTITPISPEITSPMAISVKVEYKVFKEEEVDNITMEIINSTPTY